MKCACEQCKVVVCEPGMSMCKPCLSEPRCSHPAAAKIWQASCYNQEKQ